MASKSVIVVGGGVFGLTAAIELQARGWSVELIEPSGASPDPRAESTDISKVVRADYGADGVYTDLALESISGWHEWNRRWQCRVFEAVGLANLSLVPLQHSVQSFVAASYHEMQLRGVAVQRLSARDIERRFPNFHGFCDGYFNPLGGWANSGQVMQLLFDEARRGRVAIYKGEVSEILTTPNGTDRRRVVGVRTSEGREFKGDHVIVAAGSWTGGLVKELAEWIVPHGQVVFHFKVDDVDQFRGEHFPVVFLDEQHTGFYGFPAHPTDGRVKIGHHGPGFKLQANQMKGDDIDKQLKSVMCAEEQRFREFLRWAIPKLADKPVVHSRMCVYGDSVDGDFWIDHHPQIDGLFVAAGGSGHGFKFAPVLGKLIADGFERRPNGHLDRFRWRQPKSAVEVSRCQIPVVSVRISSSL